MEDKTNNNQPNFIGLSVSEAAHAAFESGLRPHFFDSKTGQEYKTQPPPSGYIVTDQDIINNTVILSGGIPSSQSETIVGVTPLISTENFQDEESTIAKNQETSSPFETNTTDKEVSISAPPRNWKKISLFIVGGVVILSLIAFGTIFTLKKMDEASKTLVPDVITLTVEQAQTKLSEKELQLGTINKINSKEVPEGIVISQTPTINTKVKKKTTVDITISAGPKETKTPNLVGLNITSAEKVLVPLNLLLGEKTLQDSDQPKGTIIFQSPKENSLIKEGETIDVVLSNGKVKVPSVIGQTLEGASVALAKVGFRVKPVPIIQSGPAATIVAQSPDPGNFLERGTEVKITYTVPPAPVPTLPPTPVVTVTPTPTPVS